MPASSKMIGFVPTKDSAKARSFYEKKLGFRFVSDDPFALVMRAGETMIRIAKAKDLAHRLDLPTHRGLSMSGTSLSEYPHLLPHASQHFERLLQFIFRVRGRHDGAHPGLALRHRGKRNSRSQHAFFKQLA
jgi:catechol 2,3-dioxygenase-like lactoylglutathione lyase family enzyme